MSLGAWKIHGFCKCGEHLGRASFGDRWFIEQSFPVCPRCGAGKSNFVMKTARYVSDGFFKPEYMQELLDDGTVLKIPKPSEPRP